MDQTLGQPEVGDAFGCALRDRLCGSTEPMVLEREDGYIHVGRLDFLNGWDARAEWAVSRALGRVLDVGAGAGRASLALQARDQQVLALDVSPGAVEVCQRRGVREVFRGTAEDAVEAGLTATFDSVLLLGNNLGLLRSADHARSYLDTLGSLLTDNGVIVGTSVTPYDAGDDAMFAYHEQNPRRGRMVGQATQRIRYRRAATSWYDWLSLSPDELADLARPAGWRVTDLFPGRAYAVVLAKHCTAGHGGRWSSE
jgi:SAM-dependent methyltransferase